MRSEGFLFLSGGSGGGTVFVWILELMWLTFAHVRARSRCARCAVPLGLASTGVAWAEQCVAVPRGLVGRAWSGRRCAVVIGAESLVWVAPCRCDWWGEPGLGGAVPLGLLGRAWSGWRCVVGIAGESLVWVALCRCDWWEGPGLGGAVPL